MEKFLLILSFIILSQVYCQNPYENCTLIQNSELSFTFNLSSTRFNETAVIVELSNETDARCLDGTTYKFNFSKGTGSGSNKFFFFFGGGAFCGIEDKTDVLNSCKSRSETYQGSSKFLPANNTFTIVNGGGGGNLGYFSSSEEDNPMFWNWNKIALNYCDGTIHQGYLKEPINVNGTDLWFRGYNNTMGVFEWARQNLGLFEAEEILISGESSGGQAVFFWASYLQDYLPKNIKVALLSDAGYFIDEYSPNAGCNLFGYYIKEIANATRTEETDLLRRCSYKDENEKWKCLIPEYITDDIEFPFFLLNSQNDFLVLATHLYLFCVEHGSETCSLPDKEQINLFRQEFLSKIFSIKKKHPKWGFWLRNCIEHIYWNGEAWYTDQMNVFSAEINKAVDLKSALYGWYSDLYSDVCHSHTYIDLISWEYGCSEN